MRNAFTMTALAALLLGGCNLTEQVSTVTAEKATPTIETEEQAMPTFTAQQGTIDSLNQTEDGLFVEATFDGAPITFLVQDDTPVVTNTGENTTLQVGMKIKGYVYTNNPVLLIYPPRYSPSLVIVETEEMGFYSVASFDDELLNETKQLQLTPNEDMPAGDYAVFYTMSTRSIPEKTTPHHIISLSNPLDETAQ